MRHTFTPFLFLSALLVGGCTAKLQVGPSDGGTSSGSSGGGDDTSTDGGTDSSTPTSGGPRAHHTSAITKVDLLFMIDNSSSMGDKQALLRTAVPDLLDRIVNPRCVDSSGNVLGPSNGGACTSGKPEFPAIHDLHVGIVDSSLGGRGSDQCAANQPNPVNQALNAHDDDQGHLVTRGGADEHPVTDAAAGFLAFAPGGDSKTLVADFQDEVSGVAQFGCGFEAQLESWYRFLIQPDPYQSITPPDTTGRASLQGIDATLLKQRHDFLRPDSFVSVIVLTDENDSTVDPLTIGGQGWAYENLNFPGSTTGGAAMGTSACATNPNDPSCTSCGFCVNGAPSTICGDSVCSNAQHGYLQPQSDPLNERFFHMKQRFGVDPQFPISRYVNALTSAKVPDRNGEHPPDSSGNPAAFYVGANDCTNPLFAASLPTDANGELCNLAAGPRTLDMVLFAVIGGVPPSLLHVDATNPFGATLGADDWTKILGQDPLNYDFTGIDPHMLESMTPRAGLPAPTSSDTADPINGREWDTQGNDLEYSCVFDLPAPKDCTQDANKFSCDCDGTRMPPLCDPNVKTTQIRGKAYPPVRELAVARALGDQAVVGSICALHATEQGTSDPLYGYRPAVHAIANRMASIFAE